MKGLGPADITAYQRPGGGAFARDSEFPPSDPQEAAESAKAGTKPAVAPPAAPREGTPPALQLFSVRAGFVSPRRSLMVKY